MPALNEETITRTRGQLLNRHLFRLYALKVLPMVYLAGIRVTQCNDELCEVRMKYSWIVRNPFKSTFWAVLGMAAEMASGALFVAYTRDQQPKISFILIAQEGKFHKKARGKMRFVCNHTAQVREAVLQAMGDRERHEIQVPVRSLNEEGELLAEMQFTWVLQQRN